MTNEEAKNTICAFYEQILKDLWLTSEARNGLGEALDLAIKALEEQRPQGKWLHPYITNIACECSKCHLQLPITDYFNFCPNCGAYMRKGDED